MSDQNFQQSHLEINNNFINFIPSIVVMGIGGAGVNAINNMILSKLSGVTFVAANTDCQSLGKSLINRIETNSESKKNYILQLGPECTKGLGAGCIPEIGAKAAEESIGYIKEILKGTDLLFITAGMGGGTGTGASPVVAKIAKDMGILTIAVITKPFDFEGKPRKKIAIDGVSKLREFVDNIIVVNNQNLLLFATQDTGFAESFKMADDVLNNSVKCVVELLTKPGSINRDFADIKTILQFKGGSIIGFSEYDNNTQNNDPVYQNKDFLIKNKCKYLVDNALNSQLLDNCGYINNASNALVNITGGHDMRLFEVGEIIELIRYQLKEDANIIFGTTIDEDYYGKIKLSLIVTGVPDSNINECNQNTYNIQQNNVCKEINKSINDNIDKQGLNADNNFNNVNSDNINNTENTVEMNNVNPKFNNESNFSEDDINNDDFPGMPITFEPSRDEMLKYNIIAASNKNFIQFNANNKINTNYQSIETKDTTLNQKDNIERKTIDDTKNYHDSSMPLFMHNVYNSFRNTVNKVSHAVIKESNEISKNAKSKVSEWSETAEAFEDSLLNIPAVLRVAS